MSLIGPKYHMVAYVIGRVPVWFSGPAFAHLLVVMEAAAQMFEEKRKSVTRSGFFFALQNKPTPKPHHSHFCFVLHSPLILVMTWCITKQRVMMCVMEMCDSHCGTPEVPVCASHRKQIYRAHAGRMTGFFCEGLAQLLIAIGINGWGSQPTWLWLHNYSNYYKQLVIRIKTIPAPYFYNL